MLRLGNFVNSVLGSVTVMRGHSTDLIGVSCETRESGLEGLLPSNQTGKRARAGENDILVECFYFACIISKTHHSPSLSRPMTMIGILLAEDRMGTFDC